MSVNNLGLNLQKNKYIHQSITINRFVSLIIESIINFAIIDNRHV